jgi:predicted nicotinamide N-methyase
MSVDRDKDDTAFVLEHTRLEPVPFVPRLRVYTATEIVPLWHATEAWLESRGMAIPFWSVPWAGGQALARYVLDHPELVAGRKVLDVGAGSGLVAIAAAKAGAAHVCAADVDPLAAAASALNATANDVTVEVVCDDLVGRTIEFDVVLAGDVWYERATAARLSRWFGELAAAGARVFTGDPGRSYAPSGPEARPVARYAVPTSLELESKKVAVVSVLEIVA